MQTSRRFLIITTLLCAGILSGRAQDEADSLRRLLPPPGAAPGWSTTENPRIYAGEELFQHIDGGAVLFFEYGFRQTVAVEYRSADEKSINVEIYEMTDPGAAYGIYSIRSGEAGRSAALGQGSIVNAYFIMFWKGRYYVSIGGSDTSVTCRRGLESLAEAVDRNIAPEGPEPSILSLVPRNQLTKRSFVRGALGLSSIIMLDLKEISEFSEGAIGKYPEHTLLLLSYDDSANARIHFSSITQSFKSNKRFKRYRFADQIASVTDSGRRSICVSQSGQYLLFSLSDRALTARRACKDALGSLPHR